MLPEKPGRDEPPNPRDMCIRGRAVVIMRKTRKVEVEHKTPKQGKRGKGILCKHKRCTRALAQLGVWPRHQGS